MKARLHRGQTASCGDSQKYNIKQKQAGGLMMTYHNCFAIPAPFKRLREFKDADVLRSLLKSRREERKRG